MGRRQASRLRLLTVQVLYECRIIHVRHSSFVVLFVYVPLGFHLGQIKLLSLCGSLIYVAIMVLRIQKKPKRIRQYVRTQVK